MVTKADIRRAILSLCEARGPEKSICPSEAARFLAPDGEDWRDLMSEVRSVGAEMADSGEIVCLQRGAPIDARTAKGPIRFRIGNRSTGKRPA